MRTAVSALAHEVGWQPSGAFVGRQQEYAELRAGLADAVAGRGALFLLVGESGIGKTRLADEFSAEVQAGGARVLWGRSWQGGGAPAYWPWVQIVRSYLRQRDPDSLRDELGDGAAFVAQMRPSYARSSRDFRRSHVWSLSTCALRCLTR